MHQAISFVIAVVIAFANLSFQQSPPPAPSSPPQAAPSPAPQADDALKLRTDLVLVDVLPVQRRTSRAIGNLQKDDFTIYEDGIKQTVSYFSRDTLPVSVLLLVDRAGCVNP